MQCLVHVHLVCAVSCAQCIWSVQCPVHSAFGLCSFLYIVHFLILVIFQSNLNDISFRSDLKVYETVLLLFCEAVKCGPYFE